MNMLNIVTKEYGMKNKDQCEEIKSHAYISTRSSTSAEISRDAWNGHSRSLKVIHCCSIWQQYMTSY